MSGKIVKTVLLNALPAAGKSEIRKLLRVEADLSKSCQLGEQVQLDDYPYVKFMRDIDDQLVMLGFRRMFYELPDRGFVTDLEWGTLMLLINEDYEDLVNHATEPDLSKSTATRWLFERIDNARRQCGVKCFLGDLPAKAIWGLEDALEDTVKEFIKSKYSNIPDSLEGKTVFIEFSRGGPQGAPFPLQAPLGYQYSYAMLSDRILENAAVLNVWVTPEMSRAKNIARGQESVNQPVAGVGSAEAAKYVLSLNHTVPKFVMYNAYGCDDIDYLMETSGKESAIKVVKPNGKTFYLPVARFDNRPDFTSFCRGKPEEWAEKDRAAIREQLTVAFGKMVKLYNELHDN